MTLKTIPWDLIDTPDAIRTYLEVATEVALEARDPAVLSGAFRAVALSSAMAKLADEAGVDRAGYLKLLDALGV